MTTRPATPKLPKDWFDANEIAERVRRAEAYPRLVEALKEIVPEDSDSFHNLTLARAAAINRLLRELGERSE